MGNVSQEQTDDAQVQEMDISPFISAQRRNRSWGWEWEENIWMMQVALSMGGKVLDDFLEIEEQLGDIQEVFAQEIREHQHLEQWQDYLGLPSTDYILDSFNTSLSSRARDTSCAVPGSRARITNDITCVQDSQPDVPREKSMTWRQKQDDYASPSEDEDVLARVESMVINDDDIQQEQMEFAMEEQESLVVTKTTPGEDGHVLGMEEVLVKNKFDAEVDSDLVESRKGFQAGQKISPGIATRMKLLFGENNDDEKQEKTTSSIVVEQRMVVMDRVKELDRTVLVKRRKRNEQKKEEGLQVRRINDHFRSGGGSQLTTRKRKTSNGQPEKNKKTQG